MPDKPEARPVPRLPGRAWEAVERFSRPPVPGIDISPATFGGDQAKYEAFLKWFSGKKDWAEGLPLPEMTDEERRRLQVESMMRATPYDPEASSEFPLPKPAGVAAFNMGLASALPFTSSEDVLASLNPFERENLKRFLVAHPFAAKVLGYSGAVAGYAPGIGAVNVALRSLGVFRLLQGLARGGLGKVPGIGKTILPELAEKATGFTARGALPFGLYQGALGVSRQEDADAIWEQVKEAAQLGVVLEALGPVSRVAVTKLGGKLPKAARPLMVPTRGALEGALLVGAANLPEVRSGRMSVREAIEDMIAGGTVGAGLRTFLQAFAFESMLPPEAPPRGKPRPGKPGPPGLPSPGSGPKPGPAPAEGPRWQGGSHDFINRWVEVFKRRGAGPADLDRRAELAHKIVEMGPQTRESRQIIHQLMFERGAAPIRRARAWMRQAEAGAPPPEAKPAEEPPPKPQFEPRAPKTERPTPAPEEPPAPARARPRPPAPAEKAPEPVKPATEKPAPEMVVGARPRRSGPLPTGPKGDPDRLRGAVTEATIAAGEKSPRAQIAAAQRADLALPPQPSRQSPTGGTEKPTSRTVSTLASLVADIRPGERVLDPAAGTGALVAGPAATGAKVQAFEVDPERAAILRESTEGKVAVEPGDFFSLRPERAPDVVLVEPPVGRLEKPEGPIRDRGEMFLDRSLEQLAEGGRLVAVLPRGFGSERANLTPFLESLGQEHTLRGILRFPESEVWVVDKGKVAGAAPLGVQEIKSPSPKALAQIAEMFRQGGRHARMGPGGLPGAEPGPARGAGHPGRGRKPGAAEPGAGGPAPGPGVRGVGKPSVEGPGVVAPEAQPEAAERPRDVRRGGPAPHAEGGPGRARRGPPAVDLGASPLPDAVEFPGSGVKAQPAEALGEPLSLGEDLSISLVQRGGITDPSGREILVQGNLVAEGLARLLLLEIPGTELRRYTIGKGEAVGISIPAFQADRLVGVLRLAGYTKTPGKTALERLRAGESIRFYDWPRDLASGRFLEAKWMPSVGRVRLVGMQKGKAGRELADLIGAQRVSGRGGYWYLEEGQLRRAMEILGPSSAGPWTTETLSPEVRGKVEALVERESLKLAAGGKAPMGYRRVEVRGEHMLRYMETGGRIRADDGALLSKKAGSDWVILDLRASTHASRYIESPVVSTGKDGHLAVKADPQAVEKILAHPTALPALYEDPPGRPQRKRLPRESGYVYFPWDEPLYRAGRKLAAAGKALGPVFQQLYTQAPMVDPIATMSASERLWNGLRALPAGPAGDVKFHMLADPHQLLITTAVEPIDRELLTVRRRAVAFYRALFATAGQEGARRDGVLRALEKRIGKERYAESRRRIFDALDWGWAVKYKGLEWARERGMISPSELREEEKPAYRVASNIYRAFKRMFAEAYGVAPEEWGFERYVTHVFDHASFWGAGFKPRTMARPFSGTKRRAFQFVLERAGEEGYVRDIEVALSRYIPGALMKLHLDRAYRDVWPRIVGEWRPARSMDSIRRLDRQGLLIAKRQLGGMDPGDDLLYRGPGKKSPMEALKFLGFDSQDPNVLRLGRPDNTEVMVHRLQLEAVKNKEKRKQFPRVELWYRWCGLVQKFAAKKWAKRQEGLRLWVTDILNPTKVLPLERLAQMGTMWLYDAHLGRLNLKSALLNLTQNILTMSHVGGVYWLTALEMVLGGKGTNSKQLGVRMSAEEAKAVMLMALGPSGDQGLGQLREVTEFHLAPDVGPARGAKQALKVYQRVSMVGFSAVERLNRQVAALAGYLYAKHRTGATYREAVGYARHVVEQTQFFYDRHWSPALFRMRSGPHARWGFKSAIRKFGLQYWRYRYGYWRWMRTGAQSFVSAGEKQMGPPRAPRAPRSGGGGRVPPGTPPPPPGQGPPPPGGDGGGRKPPRGGWPEWWWDSSDPRNRRYRKDWESYERMRDAWKRAKHAAPPMAPQALLRYAVNALVAIGLARAFGYDIGPGTLIELPWGPGWSPMNMDSTDVMPPVARVLSDIGEGLSRHVDGDPEAFNRFWRSAMDSILGVAPRRYLEWSMSERVDPGSGHFSQENPVAWWQPGLYGQPAYMTNTGEIVARTFIPGRTAATRARLAAREEMAEAEEASRNARRRVRLLWLAALSQREPAYAVRAMQTMAETGEIVRPQDIVRAFRERHRTRLERRILIGSKSAQARKLLIALEERRDAPSFFPAPSVVRTLREVYGSRAAGRIPADVTRSIARELRAQRVQ